ncbi:MAG: RecQ family ATP-dependent DNA helicase, partial [Chloroflexota bacterium]|nr:RecQ family ATP-dependent DNA helicase [Chloroflexota bacterium]
MSLSFLLDTHFGFDSFRAGQEQAIQSLLNQQHTLAIMPTGAGKSLIFQFTALQLEGITLVISPLIALMKDQVDALNRKGIPATFINSAIPVPEQRERLKLISQGKYKLVYVAPERLRSVTFLQALQKQTLSLLAVDEAHCISEWGHDFRPDYLNIAEVRKQLGNPLTIALTATATPKVQNDIVRLLGLPDSTYRIVTGFNRPNLKLEVKYTADTETKFRALLELLNPHPSGATLIYTGTRRDAEEVAGFVRVVYNLNAEHYHAGLLPEDRARVQERFVSGATPVIVATNAFGMGIDRADVRQVIHYTLPGSLEAYYQEAGRAGRDGLAAKVVLLYDPQDRALQEFFIANSVVSSKELQALYSALGNGESEIWMTIEDFSRHTDLHPVKVKVGLAELERIGALERRGDDGIRILLQKGNWDSAAVEKAALKSRDHIKHRTDQLNHMVNYAETNFCRRRVVLTHFGDSASPDAPPCCDNCESEKNVPESGGDPAQMDHAERVALIILDAVLGLKFRVGREKLAQILAGSKAQEIKKYNYDKSAFYAKLTEFRKGEIKRMIGQLLEMEYFKIIGSLYPLLTLTPKGEAALKQKASISLKIPKVVGISDVLRARAQFDTGGTVKYTDTLFANGLTPEQISKERGLALQTIYDHIAQLIAVGKISMEEVVPNDVRERIEIAINKVGATRFLSPIKSILPEEIDFNMIRCVVAGHKPNEIPETIAFVEDKSPSSNHIQHIVALGESKSSSAIPELIVALKSKDSNARKLAASALGKIKDAQAVKHLMDLLAIEIKPQVRQYAVKALGSIRDSRAIDVLVQVSDDENEMYYTRASAKVAVRRCRDKKSFTKENLTSGSATSDTVFPETPHADPIASYLSSSHPRLLTGNWQTGFALDFHSSFSGADWNRSSIGDLTYRLKYQSDLSALPALIEHTRKLFLAHPEMDQFDIILP